MINCNLTQSADKVGFKVYTAGYRLVLKKEWTGSFPAGRFDAVITSRDTGGLSNGVYYYVIEGERPGGGALARAKAGVLVLLK